MATKKITNPTGIHKHVKTSVGIGILVIVASLIFLGVFYVMSQENLDIRSQAAKGGCTVIEYQQKVVDKKTGKISFRKARKCAKETEQQKIPKPQLMNELE